MQLYPNSLCLLETVQDTVLQNLHKNRCVMYITLAFNDQTCNIGTKCRASYVITICCYLEETTNEAKEFCKKQSMVRNITENGKYRRSICGGVKSRVLLQVILTLCRYLSTPCKNKVTRLSYTI